MLIARRSWNFLDWPFAAAVAKRLQAERGSPDRIEVLRRGLSLLKGTEMRPAQQCNKAFTK
jgi:hypothetical protein